VPQLPQPRQPVRVHAAEALQAQHKAGWTKEKRGAVR
jgi:hypothetical protein